MNNKEQMTREIEELESAVEENPPKHERKYLESKIKELTEKSDDLAPENSRKRPRP